MSGHSRSSATRRISDAKRLWFSGVCRCSIVEFEKQTSNSASPYGRSHPSPSAHVRLDGRETSAGGETTLSRTTFAGASTRLQFSGVPPTSRMRVSAVGRNSSMNCCMRRRRKRSVGRATRATRFGLIGRRPTLPWMSESERPGSGWLARGEASPRSRRGRGSPRPAICGPHGLRRCSGWWSHGLR